MGYQTLSLGITLTIPTNGTTNWGTTVLNTTWTKISNHGHTGSGDGNQIATAGIADDSVTSAKLAPNFGYTQYAITAPTGTTATVDFDNGNVQTINLGSATGDVTLTLSNPTQGCWYYMLVTQGATARDLVWPAAVKWPQAQAPIMSTGNGDIDMIKLYYDGTNYYGGWEVDYG